MNRLLWAPLLLLALRPAPAQDLQQYLRIRKANGIIQAVGVQALETLVGTRIFEVQALVKGTLSVGSKTTVMIERTDGDNLAIDAKSVPDWALGTDVMARLIIRATRSEGQELHATLIAIARDEDIEPIEEQLLDAQAKVEAARRRKEAAKHTSLARFAKAGQDLPQDWEVPSSEYIRDNAPSYAAFVKSRNPRLTDEQAYRTAAWILEYSREFGVDALLIVAMVICESDFNPKEVSSAGAMGLGQLMPETVQDYGITNPFDLRQNLYGTVREIRGHISKYWGESGDVYRSLVLGLAAYNAGEGAVKRHGESVPPYRETQHYVRKVIDLYMQMARNRARQAGRYRS